MRYRPDVDGLRALAIATVVLFHLGFKSFSGGYVGVDVFFVISGYLITGLIVQQLRTGQFSFWDFYARRTRRIFPALFVMIPTVLLVGYVMLPPDAYQNLGMSAVYSSAFLANVYFWLNTGYFDQAANTMPLLHLWSIGVEEQFYLIWPISLVVVWGHLRLAPKPALISLAATTFLFVLLCIAWTAYDAKAAFFLPFARLWEFMLGALVLLIPPIRRQRLANALSVIGVAAILAAVFAFDDGLAYPGYYALLPCLGAAATMSAGEASVMGRFLSLRPNVLLGKLSYSVYLWHWPVFVYYDYYVGREIAPQKKLWLIPLVLAIAYLCWRFVELPARRRTGWPAGHVTIGAAAAAVVACLAVIVVAQQGFPHRIPAEVRVLGNQKVMTKLTCTEAVALEGTLSRERCVVGVPWATAAKRAVIWGDSHARHLLSLLDIPAREQNLSIVYWFGCPPFVDNQKIRREKAQAPDYSQQCARSRLEFLDFINKSPNIDLVIIADVWAIYPQNLYFRGVFKPSDRDRVMRLIEDGLVQTLAQIQPQQLPVLIVGDVPRPSYHVPDCAIRAVSSLWRKPCKKFSPFFREVDRPTEAILERIASDQDRVYFLDALDAMCGKQGCPIRVGNEIIYSDNNHLRLDLQLSTRQELASTLRLGEALREAISGQSAAALR